MGKEAVEQFRESVIEITDGSGDDGSYGEPALKPTGRASFRGFMDRVVELVDGGYPRLAFQEVDDVIENGMFPAPYHEEALLRLKEGLRSITSSGRYSSVAANPYALLFPGSGLCGSFRPAAKGDSIAPLPQVAVAAVRHGRNMGYPAPAMAFAA